MHEIRQVVLAKLQTQATDGNVQEDCCMCAVISAECQRLQDVTALNLCQGRNVFGRRRHPAHRCPRIIPCLQYSGGSNCGSVKARLSTPVALECDKMRKPGLLRI